MSREQTSLTLAARRRPSRATENFPRKRRGTPAGGESRAFTVSNEHALHRESQPWV
ncbi:uncharacterized protein CMC5_045380 [Chondromyces crocatus]|uniref:Uncharacterized protein n=1 Tax=Chondromyces crocatus TaxID=52 RepID=A0A0K1EHP9_CHOCO|nr:uncharacterized protein CMC5_045380 [Chondromyces crocatus]